MLSLILVLTIGVVTYLTHRQCSTYINYSSAYTGKQLKELGITLISTNVNSKIDKNEVLKITQNMLKRLPVQPKRIFLEYGLITYNSISVNAISKEALDANPTLVNKKSISDIPVWIITFKGIIPDNYSQESNMSGKQSLDISSTVIDAETGKVLFTFGSGKQK